MCDRPLNMVNQPPLIEEAHLTGDKGELRTLQLIPDMSHVKFPEFQFHFYFIQKTLLSFVTPLNGLQVGCGFAHHSRRCERRMQPCAHATCSKTSQTASKASPQKNCILQLCCTRCLTQNACRCSSACLQVHCLPHFFFGKSAEHWSQHRRVPIHTTNGHLFTQQNHITWPGLAVIGAVTKNDWISTFIASHVWRLGPGMSWSPFSSFAGMIPVSREKCVACFPSFCSH